MKENEEELEEIYEGTQECDDIEIIRDDDDVTEGEDFDDYEVESLTEEEEEENDGGRGYTRSLGTSTHNVGSPATITIKAPCRGNATWKIIHKDCTHGVANTWKKGGYGYFSCVITLKGKEYSRGSLRVRCSVYQPSNGNTYTKTYVFNIKR